MISISTVLFKRLIFPICLVLIQGCGPTEVTEETEWTVCNQQQNVTCTSNQFSAGTHFIYKDGEPFKIRGVVYVPGHPGYLPWEIEKLSILTPQVTERIDSDLENIKAMGANTVRLWGAPAYTYHSLKELGGLNILQTIWFDGHVNDFQNNAYKTTSKNYIKTVIDRIYNAHEDNNPPIVALLVGNELSESSIISTNQAHPNIDSFFGNYISASNINASEAFIAEMADYARTYEMETYGKASLISYANEIRTVHLIDTPFLDFRSQNAYSYAVPYYRPDTLPGSGSGTLFQGWIEELKNMHPSVPLLVSETGLSVSPEANHAGPPNYGYGGNTELEQATGILQNLTDIQTSSFDIAGVTIHEYLDSWWKFGLEDSLSQDPHDIEEWFGMVRIIEENGVFNTLPRAVYNQLKTLWTAE